MAVSPEARRPGLQGVRVYIWQMARGYGDAKSYNIDGGIPTPGIDRIAREGCVSPKLTVRQQGAPQSGTAC